MLALPHTNSWGFRYANPDAFTGFTVGGVSVVPGASDAEGSWTEIVGDAAVTTGIYYVRLHIHTGFSNAASKQHLLDFGWDPAGGTSYAAFFSNFACGGTGGLSGMIFGSVIEFPCYIPAGSALAVRIQGSNGTAGTVLVIAEIFGKPSRPELVRPATYSETLGYTSGTLGTSLTPGSDAYGSWVSLGTTTKKHFWAQLGLQVDNAISAVNLGRVQLAVGDGSNKHIIGDRIYQLDAAERISLSAFTPCAWEIPSGAELWVRASTSEVTVPTGYNATAVLFGG